MDLDLPSIALLPRTTPSLTNPIGIQNQEVKQHTEKMASNAPSAAKEKPLSFMEVLTPEVSIYPPPFSSSTTTTTAAASNLAATAASNSAVPPSKAHHRRELDGCVGRAHSQIHRATPSVVSHGTDRVDQELAGVILQPSVHQESR